mmetsp:Transcript_104547/g.332547  ORF Transcript_104547/g.332547 Transcript_104547/m.332547 type:complete len:211 (+) Transcript_104547:141-773(+)
MAKGCHQHARCAGDAAAEVAASPFQPSPAHPFPALSSDSAPRCQEHGALSGWSTSPSCSRGLLGVDAEDPQALEEHVQALAGLLKHAKPVDCVVAALVDNHQQPLQLRRAQSRQDLGREASLTVLHDRVNVLDGYDGARGLRTARLPGVQHDEVFEAFIYAVLGGHSLARLLVKVRARGALDCLPRKAVHQSLQAVLLPFLLLQRERPGS